MHAVVCLKQIIDPDIPPHLFEIDPIEKKQIRRSQPLVISAFDEIALEVALQLKKKTAGTVTAVTIAGPDGVQALHRALAMGADQAILLSDAAFEGADSYGKTRILAAALKRLEPFDLVLCGRQAGDIEMGLVGPFLAEALALPFVGLVASVDTREGRLRMKRPIEAGYEILEGQSPLLVTITNDENNVPRLPTVLGIRSATRREIPVWSAAELGLEQVFVGEQGGRPEITELFIPQRESVCELVNGESGADKARTLALRLREMRLV
ncbi:MAG: electron transfer flavoprotein subunit beta/FixA family protein [Candidatus Promineifilaceae bacterium]